MMCFLKVGEIPLSCRKDEVFNPFSPNPLPLKIPPQLKSSSRYILLKRHHSQNKENILTLPKRKEKPNSPTKERESHWLWISH